MDSVNIKQLFRRYHLTPTQRDLEHYLDSTLNKVLEENLEQELQKMGVSGEEEVCVRLLHIPLSFKPGESQTETRLHWSEVIADYIKQLIIEGGENVVRYPSRFNALIDFALEISQQRMQRVWAWNQLGLADLDETASLLKAREELTKAFEREPTAIIPAFYTLAEKQSLIPFLQNLSADDLMILLDTAFSNAGIKHEWYKNINLTDLEETVTSQLDNDSTSAVNLLVNSKIARHLIENRTNISAINTLSLRQWSILVLLEIEPALFIRPVSVILYQIFNIQKQLMISTAGELTAGGSNDRAMNVADQLELEADKVPVSGLPSDEDDTAKQVNSFLKQKESIRNSSISRDDDKTGDLTAPDTKEIARESSLRPVSFKKNSENKQQEKYPTLDDVDGENTDAEISLEDGTWQNNNLISEWGGLIFLLPLLSARLHDTEGTVIEQILNDEVFSSRSVSWVLYQLIMHDSNNELMKNPENCISDSDPVLRIFCNLPVMGKLPWLDDENVKQQEAIALKKYRHRLLDAAKTALRWYELSPVEVLQKMIRRNVHIIIDSGWIDCHYDLTELDTDIRRAGLDLDPGYVPWIGKVVKIHYD